MLGRLRLYAEFIKIEHTLFALPFAYAGALIAKGGWFGFRLFILILTAFTGLRSAAMALNRIIDREIDALNPRTANRHLPAGLISLREAYSIVAVSLAVYFISAYLINKVAFELSPIPVIIAYVYPYLKRYTCLCHYVLGMTLAFAPIGGWVAVKDSLHFSPEIIALSVGVMFWVAGFDMIYGLLDLEFDRRYGLHSVGAHFGVGFAKTLSAINHIAFFALTAYALLKILGIYSLPGLAVIGALLAYEHYVIRELNERRIMVAFFNSNAGISATLLATIVLGLLF